jgi:hypothetical protein
MQSVPINRLLLTETILLITFDTDRVKMCKCDDMKPILNLNVGLCNNLMIYFFYFALQNYIYMYSKFIVVKYNFHRTLKTRHTSDNL